jgi:hypothetical protein
MAVLSRSALLSKLNSIINDNNFGDVEPSEVREVLIDIRDSAVWNDEGVLSVIAGITGADRVTNIVSLTQAEYDAISSPNASTIYFITD